ncbi:invasion associated locus B family protein [Phaeobacter inhibens]|uniref:invasion associated locus B family protein n=1 Tax=Phaeobacter inhibens TaxID=221822 RepID=UPI000C9CAAEC|nr:invasion associated locus B family protein [Phaeobacter inhibens]AUQ70475.1 Invasion protein B, involved in pathogenesis [Phaeobacter inhibens]UWR46690.1 invasion associated locus B family protein [Phaeobacter inhibens]UWR85958.1 invasion associated locus B family protein [Phaeobacter inhibens]
MIKSLTPMTLAALMALPLPVMAQDTAGAAETEESQPAAEVTTEAPKADDVLDLGQPVQDGPQLGQRYSKETHGDWDLACVKTEEESDPCSLLQIMTDTSGNPMAEFSMFRINQEGSQAVAGATVIVPLETLLPAALTISIDGAPGKRYNYSFCNPMGCVAQIGLTETDISAFKKGKKATLSLRPAPAPDQVINMELSLSGFTAGYNVVDVVKQ